MVEPLTCTREMAVRIRPAACRVKGESMSIFGLRLWPQFDDPLDGCPPDCFNVMNHSVEEMLAHFDQREARASDLYEEREHEEQEDL